MRVIHSVETWLPQTQPWLHDQLRFLPDSVETHVVCERTENLGQFGHPRIHSLEETPVVPRILDRGFRFLGFRHHLAFLRSRIEHLQPDILHSHFGHIGWLNLAASADASLPHVVTFYGQDLSQIPQTQPRWRNRYRELFRRADLFLLEGPHMAEKLAALGCPREKIAIHRLGADLGRLVFRPREWSPPDPFRVLIAASFREKKGIPFAVEALARLGETVPLEVTIIGDANRQPGSQREKEAILSAVRTHGLGSRVRFLGYQPHEVLLAEAYAHHIFLSPSVTAKDGDAEGGAPVAILEMAASGMPVVSTRHCDIPQMVVDGVNAILVEERDVEGLERAIRVLLEARGEWEGRLQEGRRHIETFFDAKTQGEELREQYASLLARTGTYS